MLYGLIQMVVQHRRRAEIVMCIDGNGGLHQGQGVTFCGSIPWHQPPQQWVLCRDE